MDKLCLLQKACIWAHMDINGPALSGFKATDVNMGMPLCSYIEIIDLICIFIFLDFVSKIMNITR